MTTLQEVRAKYGAPPVGAATLLTDTAPVPVTPPSLPAVPDNRDLIDVYLDEVAPSGIVGKMVKFSKEGRYIIASTKEPAAVDTDYTLLADQTLIGWCRFHGKGQPPDRIMGLLFDGFIMPRRDTLGDTDTSTWEIGLDGKPTDPWQHHQYIVLQQAGTNELFTFATSSKSGRKAIADLLKHFRRMERTNPGELPVIRLRTSGFNHPDARVGWVTTPAFAVVGRAPRDSVAVPDTSVGADLDDEVPF